MLDIRQAVKVLYHTIESSPAEGWQGLDWVLAANSRGVPAEMEKKEPHPYLIFTAIRHVRIKLKLRSTNPEHWAAEIAKSSLDDVYKQALVDLCEIMADIAIDRSVFETEREIEAAKYHLDGLQSILSALGDSEPLQQGGNGKAKGKKKVKRGAPVQSDAVADKRLCAQWRAAKSQGTTWEEFARNSGIKVNDLIDAQSREKYRRRRDAE